MTGDSRHVAPPTYTQDGPPCPVCGRPRRVSVYQRAHHQVQYVNTTCGEQACRGEEMMRRRFDRQAGRVTFEAPIILGRRT